MEKAVIRLGGAILPDGETWRIETPPPLRGQPRVSARYESVTFDRAVAMRKRNTELPGLGHPLVDALITYLKRPAWKGDVAYLPAQEGPYRVSTRWLVTAETETGKAKRFYLNILVPAPNEAVAVADRVDLEVLMRPPAKLAQAHPYAGSPGTLRGLAEVALKDWLSRTRAELEGLRGFRIEQVGLAVA